LQARPGINYVAVPVTLAAIFSFLIAHCFISVFEMTVDTIFICFCDDVEQNDGTSKPYFASVDLRNVMDKLEIEANGGEGYEEIK
jgi:solute carrier family 44 protein 1 (choline transporter-like protein)